MIAVMEFHTAAEVIAHAAEVRARLWSTKPRISAVSPTPIERVTSVAPRRKPAHVAPMWSRQPMVFDEHVQAFKTVKRIKAMVDAGEIELINMERKPVTEIVREVLADFPEFTIADLKSARRSKELVKVRQLAVFEVRKQRPDMSLPAIGRWFGGRDHTTILHSVNKITALRGEA